MFGRLVDSGGISIGRWMKLGVDPAHCRYTTIRGIKRIVFYTSTLCLSIVYIEFLCFLFFRLTFSNYISPYKPSFHSCDNFNDEMSPIKIHLNKHKQWSTLQFQQTYSFKFSKIMVFSYFVYLTNYLSSIIDKEIIQNPRENTLQNSLSTWSHTLERTSDRWNSLRIRWHIASSRRQ